MPRPFEEKESEDHRLDEAAVPGLSEAERRYQEIKRGEATCQDSEEVFREAWSRLK